MCFRPPVASKPIHCPNCGAVNPATAVKCIKCKSEIKKPQDNDEAKEQNG